MILSSKFTLYDLLAMFVQGFLLVMLFRICGCYQFEFFANEVNSIYSIIVCYVIGMIYHKAIESLITEIGFRNNEKCIKKSAEKFYNDYKKDGGNGDNFQFDKHSYYIAYYNLMKNGMLYNIPTLEAQVAFICRILPITLFYIIVLCCCENILPGINNCTLAIFLLIIDIFLALLLIKIQNKIYYLVWEGNEYLNKIILK
jgi:hypothetical protein